MGGNESSVQSRLATGILGTLLFGTVVLADEIARDPVAEYREGLISHAEASLHAESRREIATDNFLVVSDAGDDAWPTRVPDALEAVYTTLDAVWPKRTATGAEPVRVYFFAERSRFVRFCVRSHLRVDCLRTTGFHDPASGMLVFTLEGGDDGRTLGPVLHEAVHAFLHARFAGENGVGDLLPPWLHEGIAEYVALSKMRKGSIELGTFCRKAKIESRELRDSLKSGFVRLDVAGLVSVDEAERHLLNQRGTFYSRSWLLVDYLSREEAGLGTDRFPRLVRALAEDASFENAVSEIYGKSIAAIEREYGEHVAAFRARRCR